MKQCDTCIYGNKSECEKPCIVYKGENCELYEKRGDRMANEEAIKELSEMRTDAWTDSRQMKALEMAVKALEIIPEYKDAYNKGWDDGARAAYEHLKMCEEETSGDLISRQAVIDKWENTTLRGRTEFDQVIMMIPPVNPQENERNCVTCKWSKDGHNAGTEECHLCMWESQYKPKTGHWIECDVLKEVKCSNCRMCFRDRTNYCPNCGAKMVEPQESEG